MMISQVIGSMMSEADALSSLSSGDARLWMSSFLAYTRMSSSISHPLRISSAFLSSTFGAGTSTIKNTPLRLQ